MTARSRAAVGTGAPSPLLAAIDHQRLGCELAGSPLYAAVLAAVAADVAAGGPTARVLAPLAGRPIGDAVLLRLLAAVHELVLGGVEPDLAAHYPSAGGTPGPAVGERFVAAVGRHRAALEVMVERGVQTNEPGRSASLLGGFLELAALGHPLRVLEVGASAGLNLRFDRYRYEAGGAGWGPSASPLRFVDPWLDRTPDLGASISVAERRGCDLAPIDPTSEDGRRRLRSLVWPDQPERRARLDAALAVAAEVPVAVDRAEAVGWVAEQLAGPRPGTTTVVVHSIVLQYLEPEARRRLLAELDAAGARATPDAPLAWLRMEPGGDRAEVRLTTWPGGTTELLARSGYHGPPVAWRVDAPVARR